MARTDPRYTDPIHREAREPREDLIRLQPQISKDDKIEKLYQDFMNGIEVLEEKIAKGEKEEKLASARKKLGEKAWSMRFYGYDIHEKKLKKLGVVPSMGKELPRGSR